MLLKVQKGNYNVFVLINSKNKVNIIMQSPNFKVKKENSRIRQTANQIQCIKKPPDHSGGFMVYACPAGPKFKGIGGCSVSLISPLAISNR